MYVFYTPVCTCNVNHWWRSSDWNVRFHCPYNIIVDYKIYTFPANDKPCVLNELGLMFLTLGDRNSACHYFRQAVLTAQLKKSPDQEMGYNLDHAVSCMFHNIHHVHNNSQCVLICNHRWKYQHLLWKQLYTTLFIILTFHPVWHYSYIPGRFEPAIN